MNYFKSIIRFALPYKTYGFLNIFFNILYALFGTFSFVSLIPMLSVLLGETKAIEQKPIYTGLSNIKNYLQEYLNFYVTQTSKDQGEIYVLSVMVGLVIMMFLLKNASGYLASYFITFLKNGVLTDLRSRLYQKIIEMPISYFSEKRKGDIMARMTSDIIEVHNSFLSILTLAVREPLTILFTIIVMFTTSVKLTLFVFFFIPISGFIISKIGKRLKKHSLNVQQQESNILSILEETLSGHKIIKGFTAEPIFTSKFQDTNKSFLTHITKLHHRQNLASPMSEFLGICVIAVLLWYGGRMVFIEKTLTSSAFLVYMGLAYNILTPAKAISKASYGVQKGNAAAQRVLEVLNKENNIKDIPNPTLLENFCNKIEFNNIDFAYEKENILNNFSLEIPKGKTVALVGQSGSGKSTIANLITRFYDCQKGNIRIDGTCITQIPKKQLRNLIGIVTQDALLFNDTIEQNLLLGKPNATQEEILKALEIANAWEFVKELPKGIHTNIGDNGNKLSGGQKQRLCIARAVLKNPPIMILDEATSALDTESEKNVQIALENMMKNRTSIVIAHRLSTIQNADTIVVMQKGKILEQNTHQKLLEQKGTYARLVALQQV